jgi:hypothetical protein
VDDPSNEPTSTLNPTWDQFRRIVADFHKAADTANGEELDAGAKCVGLAFLGIQWDEGNKMHEVHRQAGAPALMRIVTRKVIDRQIAIESEEDRQPDSQRSAA